MRSQHPRSGIIGSNAVWGYTYIDEEQYEKYLPKHEKQPRIQYARPDKY